MALVEKYGNVYAIMMKRMDILSREKRRRTLYGTHRAEDLTMITVHMDNSFKKTVIVHTNCAMQ